MSNRTGLPHQLSSVFLPVRQPYQSENPENAEIHVDTMFHNTFKQNCAKVCVRCNPTKPKATHSPERRQIIKSNGKLSTLNCLGEYEHLPPISTHAVPNQPLPRDGDRSPNSGGCGLVLCDSYLTGDKTFTNSKQFLEGKRQPTSGGSQTCVLQIQKFTRVKGRMVCTRRRLGLYRKVDVKRIRLTRRYSMMSCANLKSFTKLGSIIRTSCKQRTRKSCVQSKIVFVPNLRDTVCQRTRPV